MSILTRYQAVCQRINFSRGSCNPVEVFQYKSEHRWVDNSKAKLKYNAGLIEFNWLRVGCSSFGPREHDHEI